MARASSDVEQEISWEVKSANADVDKILRLQEERDRLLKQEKDWLRSLGREDGQE